MNKDRERYYRAISILRESVKLNEISPSEALTAMSILIVEVAASTGMSMKTFRFTLDRQTEIKLKYFSEISAGLNKEKKEKDSEGFHE